MRNDLSQSSCKHVFLDCIHTVCVMCATPWLLPLLESGRCAWAEIGQVCGLAVDLLLYKGMLV